MSNDRIKYYGKNDLGTYHYLSRLYSFLDNTDFKQPISDINTAIEWHNVIKLLDLNIKPDNLTEDSYAYLQEKAKQFPRNIGIFLQTINDDNLLEVFNSVNILYKKDFIKLFNDYKILTTNFADITNLVLNFTHEKPLKFQRFFVFIYHSHSTKPNQFCLEIILCRIRGAFDYLMYPYYPAYMG